MLSPGLLWQWLPRPVPCWAIDASVSWLLTHTLVYHNVRVMSRGLDISVTASAKSDPCRPHDDGKNFGGMSGEACRQAYGSDQDHLRAKHIANYRLLNQWCAEIRRVRPKATIVLRAWREPPLTKSQAYIEEARASIPEDVQIIFGTGVFDARSEYLKWKHVFGGNRIVGRQSEGEPFGASLGRLIYILPESLGPDLQDLIRMHFHRDVRLWQEAALERDEGAIGFTSEWYSERHLVECLVDTIPHHHRALSRCHQMSRRSLRL